MGRLERTRPKWGGMYTGFQLIRAGQAVRRKGGPMELGGREKVYIEPRYRHDEGVKVRLGVRVM